METCRTGGLGSLLVVEETLLGWGRGFVGRMEWQEVSRVRSDVGLLIGFEGGWGGGLSCDCEA